MSNITKKSLIAVGILTALIAASAATAADVPAGVQLADKQTLVRNNGSEVQSLDPHKIEGVPESNVSRDLFEGLLISDVEGHPSPASRKNGKIKILKSGHSIYVKMRNGQMVRPSPPMISFIAGNAWPILIRHRRTPAICNTVISLISMTLSPVKTRHRSGGKSA